MGTADLILSPWNSWSPWDVIISLNHTDRKKYWVSLDQKQSIDFTGTREWNPVYFSKTSLLISLCRLDSTLRWITRHGFARNRTQSIRWSLNAPWFIPVLLGMCQNHGVGQRKASENSAAQVCFEHWDLHVFRPFNRHHVSRYFSLFHEHDRWNFSIARGILTEFAVDIGKLYCMKKDYRKAT